jgi:hypothetical protein
MVKMAGREYHKNGYGVTIAADAGITTSSDETYYCPILSN